LQSPNEQEMNEGRNVVPIDVEDTLRMGPITQYSVHLDTGHQAIVQSQYRTEDQMLKKGDKAWLLWHCSSCLSLRE
ncbi:MAG: TOBE domain-containing protein, partial [Thermodesulfobacteriota bacterium]